MRKTRTFKIAANVCRLILACTFIVSGFTKVIDPWGTALKVNEYLSIYGLDYLQPGAMVFSIWLCGAELMMGCMLLFKVRIRLISIFAVLSMVFFTLLTLLSATLIPVEDCGCFGEALKLTPWETFVKNVVLLPMAFVVWWRYRPDKIFAFKPLEIVLTCTFFFLAMYLGYYCYIHLPLVDFLPYKVGVNIREAMQAPIVEPGRVGNRAGLPQQADGPRARVLAGRHRVAGCRKMGVGRHPHHERSPGRETSCERIRPARRRGRRHGGGADDAGAGLHALRHGFRPPAAFVRTAHGPACGARREEGAHVVCLTPDPLYGVTWHEFGTVEVRCYNIDASTMKTMLRADNGLVVLDDGTITSKKNCRDIRP